MYGKEEPVYLDNAKLHLVEETANQDSFINFTIDENTHDINGIEIANNDFGAEAVTDKLNYDGGNKFQGTKENNTLHKYIFRPSFDQFRRLEIEISRYGENEIPDLAFVKEKLQLKLQERAAEDLAGGDDTLYKNLSAISSEIDALDKLDGLEHNTITRDLDITYTSYAKKIGGIEGNNLLYSDFGLLDVKEMVLKI